MGRNDRRAPVQPCFQTADERRLKRLILRRSRFIEQANLRALQPQPRPVATTFTDNVSSPVGTSLDKYDVDHGPFLPAITVWDTNPRVTTTNAPASAKPVNATPPGCSLLLTKLSSPPTPDVSTVTLVTVSTTIKLFELDELPAGSVAVTATSTPMTVSTTSVSVTVVVPPSLVIVTSTAGVYSLVSTSTESKITSYVPSSPTVVVSVVVPMTTSTVAPGVPVPPILTPSV